MVLTKPIAEKATRADPAEHVVLYDVSWEFYEELLVQSAERRLFVTYDQGVLEILSPSYEHDRNVRCLSLFIGLLSEELRLPIAGIRSTTMKRKDLRKGLEADEAFYFKNEQKVRGLKEFDLLKNPPPDLAIEVEISNRLETRIGIYSALGVPEIWRFDGVRLIVELLQADETYVASEISPTFPKISIAEVPALLAKVVVLGELEWKDHAREWIREHSLKA